MWRHPFLTGVAMVAATIALALGASKARAQEPAAGETFYTKAAILCDEKVQIDELVDAMKKGDNSVNIVYKKWNERTNPQNEPLCVLQPIQGAFVLSSHDEGNVITNGATIHTWLLNVRGEGGVTGWALYGELVDERPA
jgi:hypothetical protein